MHCTRSRGKLGVAMCPLRQNLSKQYESRREEISTQSKAEREVNNSVSRDHSVCFSASRCQCGHFVQIGEVWAQFEFDRGQLMSALVTERDRQRNLCKVCVLL